MSNSLELLNLIEQTSEFTEFSIFGIFLRIKPSAIMNFKSKAMNTDPVYCTFIKENFIYSLINLILFKGMKI